jgi:non-ribosomal peptide synthetase component F
VPITERFEQQARLTPNAVALLHNAGAFSYRTVNERANRLARRLQTLGVGPEIKVGIYVEPGLELVTGILAVLKAGGAYIPMDPMDPSERLRYIWEDSGAALLLTGQRIEKKFPKPGVRFVLLDDGS